MKIPLLKSICFANFCCKNDRLLKAKEHAFNRFDDCLDIRQIVKNHINLNLLIQLLLTRPQQFLFLHHRSQAVPKKEKSSNSLTENDSEDYYWDFKKKFEDKD